MSEQADLFATETRWFHVLKTMIDAGEVAKMGAHAFLVYCVIKSHSNFQTGRAFPGVDLISEKSGMSVRQVVRELKTLEKLGHLTKIRVGRSNDYYLRERVEITDRQGEVVAHATWDYMPNMFKHAIEDLKKVVLRGDLGSAQVVHIERLQVEIKQLVVGDNNQVVQINQADLDKLPADIQEQIIHMQQRDRERKGTLFKK